MTAFTWIGGSSSNWADPANWSPTGYPSAAGDTALIDAAGTYTVSINSGEADRIDSLALNASGATLSVSGTLAFGGANTASIEAGTLVLGSTGNITGYPDVTVAAGAALDVSGGPNQTIGALSGSGAVVLGTHTLMFGADNASTTFSGTVQGGSIDTGQLIQVGTGTLTLDNATMTNNEFIIGTGGLAVGAGTNQLFYLALGEGTGNSGSAAITGGVLNIGDPSLRSALQVGDFGGTGLVTQTGGTVNVTGSFNIGNQGGNGTYDLIGGTVNLLAAGATYDIGRNAGNNPAGSGTVNVSGGLLDIQNGVFILGDSYPNSGAHGASSGLLHQTGGTVSIESGQLFLSGVGNGEYDLDGGTLEVGGSGLESSFNNNGGSGALHMGGGTLAVTGSSLVTDATIILDSATSSTLSLGVLNASFSGTVTGAGNLEISGTGIAAFSTLGGTGTVAIDSGSAVSVSGAVGSGETIRFNGPGGTLALGTPGTFAGTMAGFGVGDRIDLGGIAFDSAGTVSFDTSNDILTIVEHGTSYSALLLGDFTGDTFNLANDGNGGTMVTEDSVPCFCDGTMIMTPDGEVAVEDLKIGDLVTTIDGASKPIVWIGMGRSLVTPASQEARPIIVRRNAITDGVPRRDLYLTRWHSLYLDGVLIPVEHLINGDTILRDRRSRVVEFYHIELPHHDVLFADGAEAESYKDDNNRSLFHNVDQKLGATTRSPWFAEVLSGGPIVDRIWRRLSTRMRQTPPQVTVDHELSGGLA